VTDAQPALGAGPLLETVLLVKLARLLVSAPAASAVQTLYDVIGGVSAGTIADQAGAHAALATITGWPASDIAALAAARGFVFPANYLLPSSYDGLRTLMAMASATDGSGAQLVTWAAVPATEADAESAAASALGALRVLYPDGAEWLQLAPGMMDPIRDRRSQALQEHLIARRDGAGAPGSSPPTAFPPSTSSSPRRRRSRARAPRPRPFVQSILAMAVTPYRRRGPPP
jgi:hypothetical protein